MVDGTYAVVVRTPVGAKKATVMLSSEDEGTVCSAIVEARGKRVVSRELWRAIRSSFRAKPIRRWGIEPSRWLAPPMAKRSRRASLRTASY